MDPRPPSSLVVYGRRQARPRRHRLAAGRSICLVLPVISMLACSQPISSNRQTASPTVAQTECVESSSKPGHAYSPEFGYGPAFGPGPVYALTDRRLGPLTNGYRIAKILWIANPLVTGSVSVVATSSNGGPVAWDNGAQRLVWTASNDDRTKWSSKPSNIYVRTAGCVRLAVTTETGQELIMVVLT